MSANPYYPVTTSSDSAQLTDDDWGLYFSNSRKASVSGFKSLCQKGQERPKCIIAVLVGIIIFIIICVIIGVAANKASYHAGKPMEEDRVMQTRGLNFYPAPEDGSILISFVPHVFRNDESIKKSMDTIMKTYESTNQQNEAYTECNPTFAPFNKTCRFTKIQFGQHCTSHGDYGYQQGQACVILQLVLPENVRIDQIPNDSKFRAQGSVPDPFDPNHIPVTCKGTTHDDAKLFNTMIKVTARIEYFPEDGLPAYFYRRRNSSLPFVPPAVAVWFRSLPNRHPLHMTCTAWGQLYKVDSGEMIEHDLLQTKFAFFLQFGKAQ